jgi:hypothetical protein
MPFTEWQSGRLAHDSYVLSNAAIVYMATPKVACTSFKHLVAALQNVDISPASHSLMAAKTNELAIHDRAVIKQPGLLDIPDAERTRILESSDVLRFCIVRDPFRRLASAWLDCILCHSLSPIASILRHIAFPEYFPDWSYLRERFGEFVGCLHDRESPHFSNHHWQRQCDLLLLDLMNYNLVARLESLSDGTSVIKDHLQKRDLIWPGLPRFNETPVRYSSQLYTASTARKVAAMYEADFKTFGYQTKLAADSSTPTLPDAEFVRAIQKRNQRIFYLSLKARGML